MRAIRGLRGRKSLFKKLKSLLDPIFSPEATNWAQFLFSEIRDKKKKKIDISLGIVSLSIKKIKNFTIFFSNTVRFYEIGKRTGMGSRKKNSTPYPTSGSKITFFISNY